jgi:hypothetical protein
MGTRGIIMFFGRLVIVVAFSAAAMLLWNLLIPEIFGLATINFWQALGLLALARILFGGFGKGGMMMHGKMGHHKNPIREKWMKMSPEQRKEFINRRREFGFGGPFGRRDFRMDDEHESGNKSDHES